MGMRRAGKQASKMPPYIVPLLVQALEIVREMLREVVPLQRYLYAHLSDLSKRISENTLKGALRRMGYSEQLTCHEMKATISTALNEIGYPRCGSTRSFLIRIRTRLVRPTITRNTSSSVGLAVST